MYYIIRYLQCENGIPTEKLCPDGLFFNSKASIFSYPCQYPPEVDCEGRTQLRKLFKTIVYVIFLAHCIHDS